jgi:Carboxypeptidase regulatory-like domain
MTLVARILCVVLLAAPRILSAQHGGLAGRIVDRESAQPLAYGIVSIEGLEWSAFTTDSGWFAFRELAPGPHVLHVRRLGYLPRDIDVMVRGAATDTIRVEMTHVAVQLGALEVKSYPPCVRPGAPGRDKDSTLAAIVDQIRLNAEQFRFLADQYPFRFTERITRSSRQRSDGKVVTDMGGLGELRSRSKSEYKPGGVIEWRRGAYYFKIPTLIEVSDKAFIDSHCWHYAGRDTIEDVSVLKVDVVAFDSLKGTDVNGSFLLSPFTFQIRRSIMHLSRRPSQLSHLHDMEVTTDFFEILPSIPVVYHVSSVQIMDPEKSKISEAYEEHRTTNFVWVKRKPGEVKP